MNSACKTGKECCQKKQVVHYPRENICTFTQLLSFNTSFLTPLLFYLYYHVVHNIKVRMLKIINKLQVTTTFWAPLSAVSAEISLAIGTTVVHVHALVDAAWYQAASKGTSEKNHSNMKYLWSLTDLLNYIQIFE